jgi:exodeoxyribonuclease VII large subunit
VTFDLFTAGAENPPPSGAAAGPRVFSVSELTQRIKRTIEDKVGTVWVEGELSNVRCPASGHYYFTIKDEAAQISAVLFRGSQRGMKFVPKDGLQVRVFGEVTVYERGGNYQILVRRMEAGGKGALQARFEALKEKLLKEGLFDESRKRPLPTLPQHVGLVTSPTGAAIRDILNILSRRFPNLHVVLAPCRVQGDGAAKEIADAIALLNARGGLDVMIVGRGGGSLEDLWAFNEEVVARAIVASRIPVISAVGHEIDFTISDFVADLRAPTPSAAAELVVGQKEAFEESLRGMGLHLQRELRRATLEARAELLDLSRRHAARAPMNLVRLYRQRIQGSMYRMARHVEGAVRGVQQDMDASAARMEQSVRLRCGASAQRVERLRSQLKALNPLAVLTRGYSITSDEQGRILRSVSEAAAGRRLRTRLQDGIVESDVVGGVPQ